MIKLAKGSSKLVNTDQRTTQKTRSSLLGELPFAKIGLNNVLFINISAG
jgi:hypothetical protein